MPSHRAAPRCFVGSAHRRDTAGAYGPPKQEHPSDVRSWFGFKVEGRHVVSVELGAVGKVDRSEELLALLELSNQQAGSLG
ncbi:MAG TPA: hypothetical protein VGR26_16185 [Acidimicrobiales bacterium]|nr:hypothetical protein [Acidimicrobiales bacterium]